MSATLSVSGVYAGYQPGIDILQDISLTSAPGKITVVVGPNGAGKSTLLKTIFGFLQPHRGKICLDEQEIQGKPPYVLKGERISYVPQGINIFPQLTVEENLRMGGWTIRHQRRLLEEQLNRIYELFPLLHERRRVKANQLSGGQARMLSTAKEVITNPRLILVDEPTAGLSPALSAQVYDFLLATQESLGCTLLVVDQNIEEALRIADWVVLINLGRVYAFGPRSDFGIDRVRALIQECLAG